VIDANHSTIRGNSENEQTTFNVSVCKRRDALFDLISNALELTSQRRPINGGLTSLLSVEVLTLKVVV